MPNIYRITMTKEEINKLTERIISGLASTEEILLYHQVCEFIESSGDNFSGNIIDDKAKLQSDIRNRIWSRIKHKESIKELPWLKRAVAAAVIISFGLSFYFLFDNKESKLDIVGASTKNDLIINDILPGGNKAILTLADGSKIILDSADNGTVTHQGGVRVIKLSNGQLSYDLKNGEPNKVVYNTITTPVGGQYQLILTDGSKVWLNAASSLRFPSFFDGNERRVEITGEAYFEVAKNKAMPFIAKVNDAEVQVLGTHFNIMAYDNEEAVETTLLEGSVKVVNGGQNNILKPDQQLQVSGDGTTKLMTNVDIDQVVAWKNGTFIFENADIKSIMRQISRWYNVEVIYQNKNINDLFTLEMPRTSKLSDVIKVLELTGNIHFEIEGKRVIITP